MSKKILTNANFNNGIAKLVESISKSLVPDVNGKTDPFIHIPEEFDPRFPVVMSSLNTVVNNADIYGLYMHDLHNEAMAFEEEKGFLIGGIADDSVTRSEMMHMINCNNRFISGVLCAELYKELYDAVYYVAYKLTKELVKNLDKEKEYARYCLFRKLVDADDTVGMKYVFQSNIVSNADATKNVFMNEYSMFTYVWYLRGILMTGISDLWYSAIREFNYSEYDRCKPNDISIENFVIGNDTLVTMYLYILDNVFNVILTSFQPKVQFCYSNSFELEKQLKNGTFGQEDSESETKDE